VAQARAATGTPDGTGGRGDLDRLLRPASVAVIGASARPGFPARALANLVEHGYDGDVYPVNPNYDELAGRRCYPSLAAIGAPVDLALIAVPAAALDSVVAECAAAGVGAGVVFSSGFAELGADGRAAQERFTAIARDGGMRLLGPNCMGVIHQAGGATGTLVASFTASVATGLGTPSGAAYAGQSGAIGGAVIGMARERGIGLTAWASTGNEADLTAVELGAALIEDDAVRVLATYLETIPDGAAWSRLTSRARELGKPVIVLRSGRSEPGRRAAASHTGAMVRGDAAFELVCARDGVIAVDDVDELVDAMEMVLSGRRPAGPRIAVLTSSGGSGAIACDRLDAAGLTLADLRPETRTELAALIPAYGSAANPVDVTAQLFNQGDEAFAAVCRPLLADDRVDGVMIVLTTIIGSRADRLAEVVARVAAESPKPVGVVWEAALADTWHAREILRAAGVPVTTSVPRYVESLRRLLPPQSRVPSPPPPAFPGAAVAAGMRLPAVVTEARGAAVLDALGVARPEGELVTSAEEAVAVAARLGGAVALKISAPAITHKTDVGGVRVGVDARDPAAVAAAYREVSAAPARAAGRTDAAGGGADGAAEGVLVQRMAGPGMELLVGVRGERDGYPAVLTVGIGGVATEIYADTASLLAPASVPEIVGALRGLRGWALLDGHRGAARADVDAAAAAVAAVGAYAARLGGALEELEINPLLVHPRGATAADLLIRFTER
jgi:acyl-CoA synthetase (NDP forming)